MTLLVLDIKAFLRYFPFVIKRRQLLLPLKLIEFAFDLLRFLSDLVQLLGIGRSPFVHNGKLRPAVHAGHMLQVLRDLQRRATLTAIERNRVHMRFAKVG